MVKFYTKFNPPPKVGVKYDPLEGRTQQQFRDECDISQTVKKYGDPNEFLKAMRVQNYLAGQTQKPMYGDFSELPDLQEAMNLVHEAEAMFMDLPAEVRDRFANDPNKLINFCRDPKNYDEAVELGLVNKREETVQGTAEGTPSATTPADGTTTAPVGDNSGSPRA